MPTNTSGSLPGRECGRRAERACIPEKRDAGWNGKPMTLDILHDPARPEDIRERRGVKVDTLVLHTTEGHSLEGAERWWDREDVTASAHYLVDGRRIVQRVDESKAALHAANMPMNRRSIGI